MMCSSKSLGWVANIASQNLGALAAKQQEKEQEQEQEQEQGGAEAKSTGSDPPPPPVYLGGAPPRTATRMSAAAYRLAFCLASAAPWRSLLLAARASRTGRARRRRRSSRARFRGGALDRTRRRCGLVEVLWAGHAAPEGRALAAKPTVEKPKQSVVASLDARSTTGPRCETAPVRPVH
jgi:hypothetical protein